MTQTSKIYSDLELCTLIQHGNRTGFDALYDQYCGIIYGMALQTVQSREHAEEIVELAFVEIWKSIRSFNCSQMKFKCWAIGILMMTIKNYLQSKNISYSLNNDGFPILSFDYVPKTNATI